MNPARCLVVAKSPVAGQAKTRLGSVIGMSAAAEVAAAALLDTLAAGREAFAPGLRHLALSGDLARAARGGEIAEQLREWSVFPQVGNTLSERLAAAHTEVGRGSDGPTVQIGMDTPQVTASLLGEVTAGLRDHPAVLGRAPDGGWWVLALREPAHAEALMHVPTSTDSTSRLTRDALEGLGLTVGPAPVLRDVDTVEDARAVAAETPRSRFARAWASVDGNA